MTPPSPSISPGDLVSFAGKCSTKRELRLLHGALLRRRHLLPAADAVAALAKLRRAGAAPDAFTFTFALKSCSRCVSQRRLPSDLHAHAIKHGCLGAGSSHVHVHNALLHGYSSRAAVGDARRVFDEMPARDVISFSGLLTLHLKANDLDAARVVFDQMPHRDVVSWTAMISAYARARRPREALALFDAMPVQPDEVTMLSVVSACTALGDLATGERVCQYVDSNGFGWMVSLRNALMDMYAKCGSLTEARNLFDGMTVRSLASWNTLISAYASHGDVESTVALFHRMLADGKSVKPDGTTLLAVLTAYAHKGFVEEGRAMFNAILSGNYGKVDLTIEHYGCMVDLLGRAGQLEEAYKMIEQMPIPSNSVVWGALLGACRTHGDINMAERAVQKLRSLNPEEGGYYILLSDMYAASGRTTEAMEIRRIMNQAGAQKTTGQSSWSTPCLPQPISMLKLNQTARSRESVVDEAVPTATAQNRNIALSCAGCFKEFRGGTEWAAYHGAAGRVAADGLLQRAAVEEDLPVVVVDEHGSCLLEQNTDSLGFVAVPLNCSAGGKNRLRFLTLGFSFLAPCLAVASILGYESRRPTPPAPPAEAGVKNCTPGELGGRQHAGRGENGNPGAARSDAMARPRVETLASCLGQSVEQVRRGIPVGAATVPEIRI
uniref:DYW domain-containing protein n=1 Tax=Oryza barthii TaxID=65489 RepID=A0A0D3FEC2_9ORYZ